MRRLILPWTTVFCASTTVISIPASPWMSCTELAVLAGTMELRNVLGNIQVGMGIEVAVVETTPSTGTTLLTATTNLGMTFGDFVSIVADTQGKRLMRLVWLCSNTSGTNLSFARVGGTVDMQPRG